MLQKAVKPAVLTVVAFALWAYMTFSGMLSGFDRAGLAIFRDEAGTALGGAAMQGAVKFVTHAGDTAVLIILSVLMLGWLLRQGKKALATKGAISIAGIFLLSPLLKVAFARERPDLFEHLVHAGSKSFPSGHALRSAAIYLVLALLLAAGREESTRKRLLGAGAVLAIATGASRVYLGVHWPTDIIAAWIIALGWYASWRDALRQN